MELYGTEDLCHAALIQMRWPSGFVCPHCQSTKSSYAKARRLFQCSKCRKQTSVKAGTIFHKSKVSLCKWFLAMHLISSCKNDVAALELSRHLDVKWDTAWLVKQKLMQVMFERNSIYKLAGKIQVDDAYLGGEHPGKRGRGAAGKTPFVMAVATCEGRPHYVHVRRVEGFTLEAIKAYAADNLAKDAHVLTDGLACFTGFAAAGFAHTAVETGSGRPKDERFLWVNTGIGNLKTSIEGTCRSFSPFHTDRYLAAYEWRYNRRYNLPLNLGRLGRAATRTAPHPYTDIADVR
jgi:transposase-like protein